MRTSSTLTAVALVVGATLLATPAHAGPPGHRHPAAVPGCGAVLTKDARLTADLACPEGDGLVLEAGVTLDLRGHTLSGPGAGTGVLTPAVGDVTIRNGTISGWESGVDADDDGDEQGGTVTLERVTLRGNGTGVAATGRLPGSPSKSFRVSRSTITDNGTGVYAIFSSARLERSTVRGNRTGLHANTSSMLVYDTVVEGNGTALVCDEAYCVAQRARFVGNELAVDAGFFGAEVTDSRFTRNTVAFRSSAYLGAGTLERNRFTDNGTAVELRGTSVTLVGNEFRGNDVAFTSTEPAEEGGSTLVGNRFVRNGDAIVITEPGSQLQDNVAERNRGWGINAPGAVDLGGNRAWGNGNEPQCVGVVCDGSSGPRS